ncbi:MAG: ABC transporter substrate-binding protein, partial [Parvularculaceae bacterium]|nr:ABC transporter substrate-binding protein [Parvularculaceae bacterium]
IVSLVGELKTQAETEGEGSLAVRNTLEENLATESIGKFLLAGKAAKEATTQQRARYDTLFPSYIAAAYAEEIGQLTARDIRVKNSLERKPGDIIVQSDLFDSKGAKRASIDWRVRVTGEGEHKLLDVLVERISPLITRRQSFSKTVKDEGLDGLLTHMEETIAAGITIEGDADA